MPDVDAYPAVFRDWPLAGPVIAYLVCFLLLTWPWVVGLVTIPWDAKAHFQPQIQFLASSLARGELPLWNPYVFGGQPQIADPQSMIFSPPYLLLALLTPNPSLWAADMTLLACMALGGVGMIIWFRDQGWHWAGAIVAALAFSFGAAMAWRIQHVNQVLSLAYLPWAMLFLERTIDRASVLSGVATGIAGAMILLGRDQVALLCVYVLAARSLWLLAAQWTETASKRRVSAALAAGALTAVALTAIPILMTVLLAGESNRPVIDFEGAGRGSLHPAQLLTLVLPQVFGAAGHMADYWGPPSFAWQGTGLFTAQNVGQMYVGAIPLVLLFGALFRGRLFAPEIRFFSIALVVVLLYALGWYTPVFRALYLLPGVNLYRRPADAVFLCGGLMAILSGYAAHRLVGEPWAGPSRPMMIAIGGIVVAAFAAAGVLGIEMDRVERLPAPMTTAALIFAVSAIALIWARQRVAWAPRSAVLAIAVVLTADLAINNGPSTSSALPTAVYDVLEPDSSNDTIYALKRLVVDDDTRRDRIELAGLGFHWPNASMTHKLENTLGYNPVRLGLYSRATGAEDHIGLPDQRKFSPLMPSYRSRLADLLGLRYIAAPVPIEQIDKKLAPGEFKRVAETTDGYVYENDRALPRVLLATEARTADFASLLESGAWPELDPRKTVLLETVASGGAERAPGSVRIAAWGINRVDLDVDSPDGGWAILNDVWHPWWFAEVDGKPAPLLRANVLFRAVEVPAGKHRVVMTFRPLRGMWADLASRLR